MSDMLGHAKLTTTDRYLGAERRPEEFAHPDAFVREPVRPLAEAGVAAD